MPSNADLLSEVDDGTDKNCVVCNAVCGKRYLRPKHTCKICGRNVCGSCSPSEVQIERKESKVRACLDCTIEAGTLPTATEKLWRMQAEAGGSPDQIKPTALSQALAACETLVMPKLQQTNRKNAQMETVMESCMKISGDMKEDLTSAFTALSLTGPQDPMVPGLNGTLDHLAAQLRSVCTEAVRLKEAQETLQNGAITYLSSLGERMHTLASSRPGPVECLELKDATTFCDNALGIVSNAIQRGKEAQERGNAFAEKLREEQTARQHGEADAARWKEISSRLAEKFRARATPEDNDAVEEDISFCLSVEAHAIQLPERVETSGPVSSAVPATGGTPLSPAASRVPGQSSVSPERNDRTCAVCSRALGKRRLAPAHTCRVCHQSVCGSCSRSALPLNADQNRTSRACTKCAREAVVAPAVRERMTALAGALRGHSRSRVGGARAKTQAEIASPSSLEEAMSLCESEAVALQ